MAIKKQNLLDPVALQQTSKYIKDGLTVVSNNTDIVPRDKNGNVIVQSGSYMVIEPNSFNFNSKPMLDILDTRFNYFSFPVQVIENPVDVDVNFDFDNVSAKYIIPRPTDSKGQPQNLQRIDTSYDSNWFYNDGSISSGYKELQFTGGIQENVNSYTITKDVLNTLKTQNKTLKFTIQLQWNSLITNRRVGFSTTINRTNPISYNPLPSQFTIYKEQGSSPSGIVNSSTNPYGFRSNNYPFLQLTYIVDINDTREGDIYSISTVSGGTSWILAQNCIWNIEIDDIPNPADNLYENIYSINDDTIVLDEAGGVRLRRTFATNNQIIVE